MVEERAAELVRKAYAGEVLGAELFGRLVAAEADPRRRRALLAAQLVEEQTRGAVVALAADLAVALDDGEADRDAGRQAAEALAALSWSDRMAAVAAATGTYRELYTEMVEVLPDPEHPTVMALLGHERALNAFAAAEAAGRPDAVTELVQVLDGPHRERFDSAAG